MKVKLLKKVRKRYNIVHLPNGYITKSGYHVKLNLFRLDDTSRNSDYSRYIGLNNSINNYASSLPTEKECIEYLKTFIVKDLRDEGYRGGNDKRIQNQAKKVWWLNKLN